MFFLFSILFIGQCVIVLLFWQPPRSVDGLMRQLEMLSAARDSVQSVGYNESGITPPERRRRGRRGR